MPKIQVYYKSNYGNVLCYPYCDRAKTFIKLTGYKTFNDYHLWRAYETIRNWKQF